MHRSSLRSGNSSKISTIGPPAQSRSTTRAGRGRAGSGASRSLARSRSARRSVAARGGVSGGDRGKLAALAVGGQGHGGAQVGQGLDLVAMQVRQQRAPHLLPTVAYHDNSAHFFLDEREAQGEIRDILYQGRSGRPEPEP